MRLTAVVQLLPTPEQAAYLRTTLERANNAANAISQQTWDAQVFGQFNLHKLVYAATRESSGLSAQVVVRLIAKVADAYKLDKKAQRHFTRHGSIAYDDRILTWYSEAISIWTTAGRQHVPFVAGDRQRALLVYRQGETDLVYRKGRWYLYTTVNYPEPDGEAVEDFLGCDLGIVNILTDSEGTTHAGDQVEHYRRIAAHRRRNLQRKRTRSAHRKLQRLAGKQSRFQKNENHRISKQVVQRAKDTQRGIALEDLTGIRTRTTVRKAKRARHANWAFAHLRHCLTYKATLAGVPVVLVDPHNSSRTCRQCGCIDKANRPNQATFSCVQCGCTLPADHNAALVLAARARAVVNQPMVCLA